MLLIKIPCTIMFVHQLVKHHTYIEWNDLQTISRCDLLGFSRPGSSKQKLCDLLGSSRPKSWKVVDIFEQLLHVKIGQNLASPKIGQTQFWPKCDLLGFSRPGQRCTRVVSSLCKKLSKTQRVFRMGIYLLIWNKILQKICACALPSYPTTLFNMFTSRNYNWPRHASPSSVRW